MKSLLKGVKKRVSANESNAWEKDGEPKSTHVSSTISAAQSTQSPLSSSPLTSPSSPSASSSTAPFHPAFSTDSYGIAIQNSSFARCRSSRTVPKDVLIHHLSTLRECAPSQRKSLLVKKLRLCSYLFAFDDSKPDTPQEQKEKELKRTALLELVNYLTVFKPSFSEEELNEIFEMLSANLFRPLPANSYETTGNYNPEEDEPQSEACWPHLQVVYEFLLRLATSTETDSKLLDKYFSRRFVLQLLELFDSEDPRERDYLKTILHRIYGNFMSLRPFIRRAINNVFYRFIYESDRHNGIAELLEILGSIINGFALPLKEQHKQFLQRVLLPLHKVTWVSVFHPQLSYCVTQFLEKDPSLASMVVKAILKFWPSLSSKKELMFLNELEEILDRIQPSHLQATQMALFRQLGKSINSPHFQVSERAIYVLNNDVILRFITNNREILLPILCKALLANTFNRPDLLSAAMKGKRDDSDGEEHERNGLKSPLSSSSSGGGGEGGALSKKPVRVEHGLIVDSEGRRWYERGHWNPTIVELTADILKLFYEMDSALMQKCTSAYQDQTKIPVNQNPLYFADKAQTVVYAGMTPGEMRKKRGERWQSIEKWRGDEQKSSGNGNGAVNGNGDLTHIQIQKRVNNFLDSQNGKDEKTALHS